MGMALRPTTVVVLGIEHELDALEESLLEAFVARAFECFSKVTDLGMGGPIVKGRVVLLFIAPQFLFFYLGKFMVLIVVLGPPAIISLMKEDVFRPVISRKQQPGEED